MPPEAFGYDPWGNPRPWLIPHWPASPAIEERRPILLLPAELAAWYRERLGPYARYTKVAAILDKLANLPPWGEETIRTLCKQSLDPILEELGKY